MTTSLDPVLMAPIAYAAIRGSVRPGSPPMPHWEDMTDAERFVLLKMWVSGARDACAAAGIAVTLT